MRTHVASSPRRLAAITVSLAVLIGLAVTVIGSPASAAQAPVGLGTAASFAVLGGSTVTNTGPSVISGNLGVSPGTAVTGFPPGIVNNGVIHAADAVAAEAQADAVIAYNDAAGRATSATVSADLGGQRLVAGVYTGPTLGLTGTLTLDAQGDPNSVWVFQAGSTLITATSSVVALVNGANPCNVFWKVGSSATLGTNSVFVGTVDALTSITANTAASVQGRLLARNAAVTLDSNTITRPLCAPSTTTIPPTTVPPTTVPPTTVPPTTVPPTTVPVTTVPPTTAPVTTVPVTTVPPSTVPVTTVPPSTVPVTTVPPSTVPVTTVPPSTVPVTTVPPTTAPATTVPLTTVPVTVPVTTTTRPTSSTTIPKATTTTIPKATRTTIPKATTTTIPKATTTTIPKATTTTIPKATTTTVARDTTHIQSHVNFGSGSGTDTTNVARGGGIGAATGTTELAHTGVNLTALLDLGLLAMLLGALMLLTSRRPAR